MKKLTSVTHFTTGEGERISYTFSVIDENGALLSQNNKGNFIVVDPALKAHVDAIREYIENNKLSEGE